MWRPTPLLPLSSAEQVILAAIAASTEIPARVRKRAGVVLRAAEGVPNDRIAQNLSITKGGVLHWRGRFLSQGIRGLWDVERVPLQKRIPEAVEQAVVFDCLYRSRSDPGSRWNVSNLALRHGISRSSVSRIWQKHGVQMARLNGIKLGMLKISPDPLFAVTVYRIGGLLNETLGPVLSFCSNSRPFSELRFSSLPAAGRNLLIDRLVGEFRKLETIRRHSTYAKLSTNECLHPAIDRFLQFVVTIAVKHSKAQNHLLLPLGAHDIPGLQQWLVRQARIRPHHAPPASSNGPQWTDLAEHWLKTIAAWPMQASLVDSIKRMTHILENYPPDQLDHLVIF